MEEVYRDSAAAGCVEAAEPRDGLRNLHPELRLRRGPLRGSRPVATSTYPLLPNISRGEREEEKEKKRHQHQESTTASRALGAIARTEEAPLLTSMFIWERSAAPEARSHRRFKRFLDAARLRGRPGVALTLAPRRSAAARGGPPARVGRPGGAASWLFGAGAGRAGRRCGSSSFVVLRGGSAGRSARRGAVGGPAWPRRSRRGGARRRVVDRRCLGAGARRSARRCSSSFAAVRRVARHGAPARAAHRGVAGMGCAAHS